MPIRVALNHKTEYTYDRPVDLQPHVVRLRPAPHCRREVLKIGEYDRRESKADSDEEL